VAEQDYDNGEVDKSSPGCMEYDSALLETMEKAIFYSVLHGEGDTPCPALGKSDRVLSSP
jgi:hypothetical protein